MSNSIATTNSNSNSNSNSARLSRLWIGALVGTSAGFFVKELGLLGAFSIPAGRTDVTVLAVIAGALVALTPLRRLFIGITLLLATLWLAVAYTPLTRYMAAPLERRDTLRQADAVFVLGSGLQMDGELTSEALNRLVGGLRLLGEGWADRLILSELPPPYPSHRDAACALMEALGLENEVFTVGPVRTTRDEAVLVADEMRVWGFETLIVVTAPSHSRRASATIEHEGVEVISVPSVETHFDSELLGRFDRSDDNIVSFGRLLHEYAGFAYYSLRGWIAL
jgi:uncharacterized SAM-binding protein YcdF (DUF218 family)